MTVLGIDPGTTRMGYAVVTGRRDAPRLVLSGVLGNPRLDRSERLLDLYQALSLIIKKTSPDVVALEKLFFSKNVKTALAVAEARGIILLTAVLANRRVYEYTPQEIKIALTSRGNAEKRDVARMIRTLLHLTSLPRMDDETDAIAIAITGLIVRKSEHE